MNDYIEIPYNTLTKTLSSILFSTGMKKAQAEQEAEIMAEADLCGTPSHGIRMLPGLLQGIKDGLVNPSANTEEESAMGAICILNGHNGPGRNSALIATRKATALAKQFGVGVCLTKNTTHWGRAHAYAYRGAQEGCILLCTTNAIPTMAIAGAKTRVIGNNPLAIGAPGPEKNNPLVLDMAMSQAAVGKVNTWLREDKPLPKNWGIDNNGNPTNDASEILKGAVTPMGEHKGAGLSVMFEVMTAALAGATLTQHISMPKSGGTETHTSKIFIALDIKAFIEPKAYAQKVAELLQHLKSEAHPFYYPGERGWATRDENLKTGVKIHRDIVKELAQAGIVL